LNSPHERSPEAQRLVEERAVQTGQGGPGATLDTTIERWFTKKFIEECPDYINRIREWVLINEPAIYTQCRQVLAKGVIELVRPDPPISHPTLVMTCENDSGSTPAMSYSIASEIEGSRTVVVPELQHMGLTEQPGLFIKPIQEFLDGILEDNQFVKV
jgi:pimeloyl-ACP methyl ester carboxylesterase